MSTFLYIIEVETCFDIFADLAQSTVITNTYWNHKIWGADERNSFCACILNPSPHGRQEYQYTIISFSEWECLEALLSPWSLFRYLFIKWLAMHLWLLYCCWCRWVAVIASHLAVRQLACHLLHKSNRFISSTISSIGTKKFKRKTASFRYQVCLRTD